MRERMNIPVNVCYCMGIRISSMLMWILLVLLVGYWDAQFIGVVLYVHFLGLMIRQKYLFQRVLGAYDEVYKENAVVNEIKKRYNQYSNQCIGLWTVLMIVLIIFLEEFVILEMPIFNLEGMLKVMDVDIIVQGIGGGILLFDYVLALMFFYFFIRKVATVDGMQTLAREIKATESIEPDYKMYFRVVLRMVLPLFLFYFLIYLAVVHYFDSGLPFLWLLYIPFCFYLLCIPTFSFFLKKGVKNDT